MFSPIPVCKNIVIIFEKDIVVKPNTFIHGHITDVIFILCEILNNVIGGSKTSQHRKGEAADIEAFDGNNANLFKLIKSMIESGELEVGQLIWEYGTKTQPNWVHVSLPMSHKKNQILYYYSK